MNGVPEQIKLRPEPANPISEEEANQFANAVVKAAKEKNARRFSELMPLSQLADRILETAKAPAASRERVAASWRSQPDRMSKLMVLIVSALDQGGDYKFLKSRVIDGRRRSLFRLVGSDDALNYHDVVLTRDSKNQVIMEDIFVLASGEMIGETMWRAFLPLFPTNADQTKLRSDHRAYLDRFTELATMNKFIQANEFDKALTVYRDLPDAVQPEKYAIIPAMNAARHGNDEVYMGLIERYRKKYPGDPSIDLISIDYFRHLKQFGNCHDAIDRVDKFADGDPYLDAVRADIFRESGEIANAKAKATKAIESEPALARGYWCLVELSLKEGAFGETAQWLTALEEKCGVSLADLTTLADYADFVKSTEYVQWSKRRTRKPADK